MSGTESNTHSRIVLATPHERHDPLEDTLRKTPGIELLRVRSADALNATALARFDPGYIFFVHWSWRIPEAVYSRFECVVFHMTDLPFGRGGSPLQNLIVRGIGETQLCALRCVEALDAGPVYLRRSLSLHGTAEEILLRASLLTAEMIRFIIKQRPVPVEQFGEPVIFERRRPEQSDLSELENLASVFDHIRMLDAEGYPAAFIETEHLRFEFTRASLRADHILADVRITRKHPRGE